MIRKIAHISFVTDNIQGMVDFYTRVLGLPIQFVFRNNDDETFGYCIRCGDSNFIEIFDRVLKALQWMHPLDELRTGNRIPHFCLEVTGIDDVRSNLVAKGQKVSPIVVGMERSRICWLEDPDGNTVELIEYNPSNLYIQNLATPPPSAKYGQ